MYYKEQQKQDHIQIDVFGSNNKYAELCPDCHGSGSLQNNTCSSCNGRGII